MTCQVSANETSTQTHAGLVMIKKLLFDPCRLSLSAFQEDVESKEYTACSFKLNEKHVVFRTSKITPKKVGQFVTIWKRNNQGITQPFTKSDALDYLIVFSCSGSNKGLFIFPKHVLIEKDVITDKKEGKRGIRVYPSWDKAVNAQAEKTQRWQTTYFLTIKNDDSIDIDLAKRLLAH